jgi:hypothetical protein
MIISKTKKQIHNREPIEKVITRLEQKGKCQEQRYVLHHRRNIREERENGEGRKRGRW